MVVARTRIWGLAKAVVGAVTVVAVVVVAVVVAVVEAVVVGVLPALLLVVLLAMMDLGTMTLAQQPNRRYPPNPKALAVRSSCPPLLPCPRREGVVDRASTLSPMMPVPHLLPPFLLQLPSLLQLRLPWHRLPSVGGVVLERFPPPSSRRYLASR